MKLVRVLLPFLVAAAFAAGCSQHDVASADLPDLPPAQVRVAPVESHELAVLAEVTGTVRPVQRATIAAKVMGTITDLPVTLGQTVRQGDMLLQITAAEISARVLQAQAQLNQAQRDLTRESTLLAQNASTPDTVKGLEDRVAMTAAMVREAEVMLDYATITAPFDGVIARQFADTGDLASPGMPLLEIEGTGAFEIHLGIPDSLASQLQLGAGLPVNVPTANLSFTGKLTEISSAADANTHTIPARIAVPGDIRVRSGQFARVQIPGAPTRVLLMPATAVTTLGQMDRVFVAVDQRAVLRLVKPGARRGESVEILSGLTAGEVVVINPSDTLREGQPLEILP